MSKLTVVQHGAGPGHCVQCSAAFPALSPQPDHWMMNMWPWVSLNSILHHRAGKRKDFISGFLSLTGLCKQLKREFYKWKCYCGKE